jgi:hypothetical protein
VHACEDKARLSETYFAEITSVTPVGKVVDVGLEAWAIFVVTAVAGSFATFFSSGDTS